ncbi:lysine exporter LysO family protein [Maledivibacter halophilus]|uniref:Predicted membrane protein n=1 Tax=Maledivibacter halophilus TaxID=36842 RepID=A0A1T5L0K1_9FIRM|nr:lysine exporter LysO family protein [Maledivibacter halophilus]SKC69612.1 Predicted membrane protein [Maledivibacter halophilus]
MTIHILISIVVGIVFGYFIAPEMVVQNIDFIIDFGLCLLLFFVGIDIGKNKDTFNNIKKYGLKILLIPITVVLGTLFGSVLASFFLKLSLFESVAVGAGLGWYSLSAIELSKYSAELGTIAFLANVSREVIALILIPIIAKKIGHIETIAAAGAPSMDTLLPVITKATNSSIAILAFFSGVVLSMLVPILVPLIISFN